MKRIYNKSFVFGPRKVVIDQMNLEAEINNVFPEVLREPTIPDSFIEENESIMELEGEVDYFKVVPAYMLWCLKFKDEKLVDMNTVSALHKRTMQWSIFLQHRHIK